MATDGVQALEALVPAGRVHAALDGVVEQLEDLRNRQEHRHPLLTEGLGQHRWLEAGGVDDHRSGKQRSQESRIHAVHVRQREDRQDSRLGPERHHPLQ